MKDAYDAQTLGWLVVELSTAVVMVLMAPLLAGILAGILVIGMVLLALVAIAVLVPVFGIALVVALAALLIPVTPMVTLIRAVHQIEINHQRRTTCSAERSSSST